MPAALKTARSKNASTMRFGLIHGGGLSAKQRTCGVLCCRRSAAVCSITNQRGPHPGHFVRRDAHPTPVVQINNPNSAFFNATL